MGKKGISAVVATVLIILITVAAVTIVWQAVIPMIKDNLDFSSLEGRVDIVTSGGYTFYDSASEMASVQIKRGADDGVMDRINIMFSFGGNSISSSVVAPDPGNTKVYVFDMSEYGEPEEVSVAPVFLVGEKEKLGGVTSTVPIGEGEVTAVSIVYVAGGEYYGSSSCLDIFNSGDSVGDGIYSVDVDGEGGLDPFDVYCDMTLNGGGWTLIGSYVDGSFFYDCTDVGMSYGTTCQAHCGEFTDDGKHCDSVAEKSIQDSEINKLKLKYAVTDSFGTLSDYTGGDFVSPAYYEMRFTDSMFSNNQGEYISYDFSEYETASMKDFYANENMNHLELRIPAKNSNLDISVNGCDTLELAVMMADNDGGSVNYDGRKYGYWSSAFSGPGWDSSNNGGCHYDDAIARWGARMLGGQSNEVSSYILWFVR